MNLLNLFLMKKLSNEGVADLVKKLLSAGAQVYKKEREPGTFVKADTKIVTQDGIAVDEGSYIQFVEENGDVYVTYDKLRDPRMKKNGTNIDIICKDNQEMIPYARYNQG